MNHSRSAVLSVGILFDSTMCIGCGACSAACKEMHDLPGEENPPDLDGDTFTVVGEKDGVYYRNFCHHCVEPACVSACLVGALYKTKHGPVLYDASKCIGCRYCFIACPYDIPRYQWEKTSPLVRKCDFCAHLLKDDGIPACAEICPTGATAFGEREDLLRQAHERIKSDPGLYHDRVFGEREAGGACVLVIADRHLKDFGLKVPSMDSGLPDLTWRSLSKVPGLAAGTALALGGVWFITNRRKKVADAEQGGESEDEES